MIYTHFLMLSMLLLRLCTYLQNKQYVLDIMDLYIVSLSYQYMPISHKPFSHTTNTRAWTHLVNHQYFIIALYKCFNRFNTFAMNLYTYLLDYQCVWIDLHTCSYVLNTVAMGCARLWNYQQWLHSFIYIFVLYQHFGLVG